jgi:hypothetical protein
LLAKRRKCAARQKRTLISGGEIKQEELDAMLVVCFDGGFGIINLSDLLRGPEKCILFL